MTTNRIKVPSTIITRARAEEILGEIATLTIEQRRQMNALDGELTAARERYEEPLATLGKQIEEKGALLESWASANRDEEFPRDRKSVELLHGIVGFRTGTPKLKTLRGWTWDRVLEAIKSLGKPLAGFVRTKEEVNKELIIAAIGDDRMEAALARQIGVQVVQEESFFVEPKLEEQPARKVVEMGKAVAA